MIQKKFLACMDKKYSQVARPLTREEFYRMIDSDAVLRTMRMIERTADEEKKNELKGMLPVAYYACLCPEGGKRPKLEYAEASGLCIHDWDHMEVDVREFYLINIKGREKELGIVLVHKTPRGSGLRIVSEMQDGESIVQCQERMAKLFGMEKYADECIKDITRMSFVPAREYFYYMDNEKLFEREANRVEPMTVMVDAPDAPDVSDVPDAPDAPAVPTVLATPSKVSCADKSFAKSLAYEGIAYDKFIDELLRRIATEGKPVESERNNDLYALVRELRHIAQYNFELIRMLVTPYFSDLKDREIRSTINSALNSNGRTITPTMKGIINQLKSENITVDESKENERVWPKMPKLPPFMEMVCSKFPKNIQPQVALAMLPILGCYGTHVRFRYCDNRVNSLSFQVAVVGKSGRGKAFAEHLYRMLTPKFEALDKEERKKEQEFQEKLKKRKEKEDYPDDPRAKVRLFSDEITTSQMLEYLDNLGGEHGLQFTEEVARLCKAKKTHYGDNDDLYCKAFDNAIGGKESKNNLTRNIRIPIFLNTLFCGTPHSMHQFYNNPEGGLNNRVIFASMPEKRNSGIPFYQDFSVEEEKMRDEILDKLWALGTKVGDGEFEFPFLDEFAQKFIRKCDKEDDENPDETWRDLANRSCVMGYRAGVLAYFLWDCPEDEKTRKMVVKFANWVATTARISIYNFCGNEYDKLNEMNNNDCPKRRNSKNKKLFSVLGDRFTVNDVIMIRTQNGDSNNVAMVISRWVSDGLIRKQEDGTYCKMKAIS